MAKIIFDQGLGTEKELAIDSFTENLVSCEMYANKSIIVGPGTIFPVIKELIGLEFSTIKIENDEGIVIPVIGDYDIIKDFNVNYYDEDKNYNYRIVIGRKEIK